MAAENAVNRYYPWADAYDIMNSPYTGQTNQAAQSHPQPGGSSGGGSTSKPASAEAKRYFASFSAADQAAIRASWGGADRMQEWYENAVKAGAVGPGSPNDPLTNTGGQANPGGGTTTYTGPADTRTWQTGVEADANGVHPDSLKPSGDPFVDMIRQQAQGQSEDMKRFSNAQVLAWKEFYDPEASAAAGYPKFKNDFGDIVNKPTESGPLSKAAGYATGERSAGTRGGGGGGGGVTAPATSSTGSLLTPEGDDELEWYLAQNYNNRQGIFGDTNPLAATSRTLGDPATLQGQLLNGGGLWWGQKGFKEGGKAPGVVTPTPSTQPTSAAPGITSPVSAATTPDVSGGTVSSPVNLESSWLTQPSSPLEAAVAQQFRPRQKEWWEV